MADREKVLGHLYDCVLASKPENMWVFARKDIVGDAIAILKKPPEIIYCKDCKYLKWMDADDEVCFCGLQNMGHHWNFFCADGERRECSE